jgi:hypothetical protein
LRRRGEDEQAPAIFFVAGLDESMHVKAGRQTRVPKATCTLEGLVGSTYVLTARRSTLARSALVSLDAMTVRWELMLGRREEKSWIEARRTTVFGSLMRPNV